MEKRLGRGLAQIIESPVMATQNYVLLRTDQIKPSRYQPRETFDEAALEELKASVKQHGIIEPILVRPIAHGIYELIAGERRWRAANALGMQEIPAIIRAVSDQKTLEFSLIENIQRAELNPIEEAKAFTRLISEFLYTQEQAADAVGKPRSSVANTLRLLKLPSEIQAALSTGKIAEGHAKVLLGLEQELKQLELFQQTLAHSWSVRELEKRAGQWHPRVRRRRSDADPQLKAIEDGLRQALGTKVAVLHRKRGGRIVIDYFSAEDLVRISRALGAEV